MKHFRELAKGRKTTKESLSQLSRSKPRQPLTELERLPAELLEHIFFYAGEVSLPQASLTIGKTLSNERIYRKTLVRAFGGNSLEDFTEEQEWLQHAVLNTKWCTVDRIRSSLPSMARSTLKHAWHSCCKHNKSLRDQKIDGPLSNGSEASVAEMEDHFNAKYDESTLRFICHCRSSFSRKEYPVFHVNTIPESVIQRSTNSEDHLEMLRLLRQGWRQGRLQDKLALFPKKPIPDLESVFQSMTQAIARTNLSAFVTLAELASVIYLPWLSQDFDYAWRNTDVPVPIPPELFRCATQPSQAAKYLQTLVRLSAKSLPKDDAKVTQWATRTRDEEGEDALFAGWLLKLMEHGVSPNGERIFTYGAPNNSLLASFPPSVQTARTFDVDCGYNLSVFDIDNPGRYFWLL